MLRRSAGSRQWKIVLHFQGTSRECFLLRENKGNFYAILALADELLHNHVSYHASGQRHFKVGPKGREPDKRFVSICQSPSTLRGVELVLGAPIFRGQFQKFRLYKASPEPTILIDADAAHFRDDVIFVRVFLIEPNSEPTIPVALHSGPPLLHVIKETQPWVGIAFFQQSDAVLFHDGIGQINGGLK
jgi:hypothetical protein